MQLEGSSSIGNNEGGGVVGAQAVPQDPLLSLLTDLDNDVIGYQEAVPSTDGADGEVVVVGEIIGQDALHLSGAQDVTLETEGMATGTQIYVHVPVIHNAIMLTSIWYGYVINIHVAH